MKAHKYLLPKFTPRLTAFLLFLSMLLTVFPSYTLAEDVIDHPPSVDTQTSESSESIDLADTSLPAEAVSSVSSVSSVPVASGTANTWIELFGTVDMTVGEAQLLRVRTTLSDAQSATISLDTESITAHTTGGQLQGGEFYVHITAQHEGTATLTATVYCTNGTTETATVEIYVMMDDGIYAIKSCATQLPTNLGDYYLRVGEPGAAPPIIHASTNTYGDMMNNIYRYWDVEYAGNGDYYIRPLMDELMSLCPIGYYVTISGGSPERWRIQYHNGGYEITTQSVLQDGEGMVLSSPTAQSGIYSSTLEYYYVIPRLVAVQNMAFERWEFIESDVSGVYFRSITMKKVYETFTAEAAINDGQVRLIDFGYVLVSFGHEGAVRWMSSNTAIAEVNATTGVITPKKRGTVTITAYVSGTQIMRSFTVTFTLNGTYFLRNLQTDLYADIQNGTMSNGNEVEQQTFDGANTQKWVFIHIGSNVYTIRSSKNNAYYLGVQNDSTADGANIVLRTGTLTSGMKWRIEEGNEGYKIVSYSDSTMVLATYSSNSTAGQKLILGDYVDNNSYRDEWLLSLPSSQVQLEGQETSMWCWVASARMMSFRYQDSPISQASTAVYIKLHEKTLHPTDDQIADTWISDDGSVFGGSLADGEAALEYLTGIDCYSAKKIYSEEALQSLLDESYPVRISRGVYDNSGNRTSAHAYVITNYYWDSAINEYVYVIFNPSPVGHGRVQNWTYEAICDGSSTSPQTDNRIWDRIIVYKKGDYTNTMDNPSIG